MPDRMLCGKYNYYGFAFCLATKTPAKPKVLFTTSLLVCREELRILCN